MTKQVAVAVSITNQEAAQLWEDGDWLELTLGACRDISSNVNAYPEDRELALAMWGAIIGAGYASEETPDGKPFIKVLRDTQLSIVRGRPLKVDEDQRQLCRERLIGVKMTVETVSRFLPVKKGSLFESLKGALKRADGAEDEGEGNPGAN